MIKKTTVFILFGILLTNICSVKATEFKTLDEIRNYADAYEEYPDNDNANWLNPHYTSFHKKNTPGWFEKASRFFGIKKRPLWNAKNLENLLETMVDEREKNGYIDRFVQKLAPPADSRFIIFGDLHGSFHSLVRDLTSLKHDGIIDNNLKLIKNCFLVFNGNAINLSPFILETLTVILRLMEVNPNNVIYIRGLHEDKEHWRNFGLLRELRTRAPKVPEKLMNRFFGTLPLALYLIGREGSQTEIIRISYFDRDYSELNEDNFADFFVLDGKEQTAIRNLNVKTESPQTIDVKVIIKSEDRLTKHSTTQGLTPTDSDKGATAWMVLSAQNRTFRALYRFFYDAFAIIQTNGSIMNWRISLYNRDVRDEHGKIKKTKEYNLATGDEITGETQHVKTLKKQVEQLQSKLKECQLKKKPTKRKETIQEKPDQTKKEIELAKKETEIAKKEAALALKEAELAKKAAESAQKKTPVIKKEPQEIVIGTTLGLTGNVKEESESVKLGLKLRIDKQNREGGINGKKIRLIVLDDGYNPNRARENALELINKYKVNVILFPVGSATTKAYLDLVKDKKVAVLFTSSGSPALRNPTPEYFIHFRPSYPAMSDALITYAQKTLDAKRFALLTQSDVTAAGLRETLRNAGIPNRDIVEVTHKRNITDMSKQSSTITNFNPDAIILWTTSAASMAIIKGIGAENLIHTKMLGADLGNPIFNEFLKDRGLLANYIDAQAIPNPKTSPIPILKEYREQIGKKPIDGLSAEAYICASIFIHLLKLTGGSTDKAELIKKAEDIKNLDLGGIKLSFDKKDRRLSRFIWLNNGKKEWIPVDVTKLEKEKQKIKKIKKAVEKEKPPSKKEQPIKPKGPFVIGSTLDMSKSLRFEGKKMREGLDVYIRKINREGGIRGQKVKLVVLDDGYDPKTARKNVETLIKKYKTNIILSSLGSPTTAGYLDLIKEKKVLVVFPFTGSPVLRDPSYSNILHLTPPYDQIELALFKYGIEKLGIKKFSLFAQADEMTAGVKNILKLAGVKKENYTFLGYARNTTDFSKQVKELEMFKPTGIALLSTSRAATEFLRQVGVEDLVGKKLLGIQLGDINFKEFIREKGLGKQFVDIQTVPNPESNLPILIEYRKEMGTEKPDAYSAVAYIAAAIFFDILKKIKGPITNKSIIAAAEKTKNYNLGGLNLNFEPSSRTILNYIWFDTGQPGDWDQVKVEPKNLKAKK